MPVPESIRFEIEIAKGARAKIEDMEQVGKRSAFGCPDCHGVMWEIDEGELVRYRCHVGHTYTAEMMSLAIDDNLSRALGSALRALEERRSLAHKLQVQAKNNEQFHLATSWMRRVEECERELGVIRNAIVRLDKLAMHEDKNTTVARTAAE